MSVSTTDFFFNVFFDAYLIDIIWVTVAALDHNQRQSFAQTSKSTYSSLETGICYMCPTLSQYSNSLSITASHCHQQYPETNVLFEPRKPVLTVHMPKCLTFKASIKTGTFLSLSFANPVYVCSPSIMFLFQNMLRS